MKLNDFTMTLLACVQHKAKVVIDKSRLPQVLTASERVEPLAVQRALEATRDAAGIPNNMQFFNPKYPAAVAGNLIHIAEQRRQDLGNKIGDEDAFYGDIVATFFFALTNPDAPTVIGHVQTASPFFVGQ